MAAKKFYAVKTGKIPGIFDNWAECKASVDGYPNAEYKGFATRNEACAYLGVAVEEDGEATTGLPDELIAYVDGSYEDSIRKYAFGCVFLLPDGRIYTTYGNGDNEQSLALRNVTGEMLGSMYAVKMAIKNGYRKIEIRYDYEGVEKWVSGEWKAKTDLTQKYAASMREWSKLISISFTKVMAHTNVLYNELADKMAKIGLEEGNGIPAFTLFAEMEEYRG
jgi:ribonuclease HI